MRKNKSTILNDALKANRNYRLSSPKENELPSDYADRLGLQYSSKVTITRKKQNGQFFTPVEIARFMASLSDIRGKRIIKILDPGCGLGILSAALCERLTTEPKLKSIELVAFETDSNILPLTDNCLNYLAQWLRSKGIELTYFLCKNDFILHNSQVLNSQEDSLEMYDIVISNPPYFKLAKEDIRAIAARKVIHGQSNIYSIFLLIATYLVHNSGQLIFITPRSFCSGNYFRLFRQLFLEKVDLTTVHLFNSRKRAFKRDKVLQENVIIVAKPKDEHQKRRVTISVSDGIEDIGSVSPKEYETSDLINPDSYQKVLHLPTSDVDEKVISIFKSWTGSLRMYNLGISTGPVVDFRSEAFIVSGKKKSTVPLFWLHNVEAMNLIWPKSNGTRGKAKGQFIIFNDDSAGRLVENVNCVMLRRFSTKDDRKRLVAAPYLRDRKSKYPMIGVENHLNYIYHKNRELSKIEIFGIAGLLNSQLFDIYFRTFNGNINVSATELRDFPLPSFDQITLLGSKILAGDRSHIDIDLLVSKIFNIQFDLSLIYGRQN